MVVDFPFHVKRNTKNGKNTLIKTRPRPVSATRGRKFQLCCGEVDSPTATLDLRAF